MTKAMHKALCEALATETATMPARIGPWVNDNLFFALRQAGMVNDSGWVLDAGRSAI